MKNSKQSKSNIFIISTKIKIYTYLFLAIFPLMTFAGNIGDIIFQLPSVLNGVVFLIIGLAVLTFFWGIVKYLMSGGDEKQLEESKKFMIWGIVGLTVMVSVWGIVSLLGSMFGFEIYGTPSLPPAENDYHF